MWQAVKGAIHRPTPKWYLDPKTTAILVDRPDQAPAKTNRRPRCVAAIPTIETYFASARASGATVISTLQTLFPPQSLTGDVPQFRSAAIIFQRLHRLAKARCDVVCPTISLPRRKLLGPKRILRTMGHDPRCGWQPLPITAFLFTSFAVAARIAWLNVVVAGGRRRRAINAFEAQMRLTRWRIRIVYKGHADRHRCGQVSNDRIVRLFCPVPTRIDFAQSPARWKFPDGCG